MLDLDLISNLIREKKILRIVINPADYGRFLTSHHPKFQALSGDLDGLCGTFDTASLVIDKAVLPGYIDMIADNGRKYSGQL